MPKKSTPLTDENRLRHMLDAALEAIAFAKDIDRASLGNNRLVILAIVKDIEIIGEAASKVSDTLRDQHPDIPWRAIIDMHNHLYTAILMSMSNRFGVHSYRICRR